MCFVLASVVPFLAEAEEFCVKMSEKQVVKGSIKKKKCLSDCIIVLYLSEDCDNWDGCWRGCWYVGVDWCDFFWSGLKFLEWAWFCWWVVMQRVCQKRLLLDVLGRVVWLFDLDSTHSFVNTQAAAPGVDGVGGWGVNLNVHACICPTFSPSLLLSSGLWSVFRSWFAVASSPGCCAFWLLLNYRTLCPVFVLVYEGTLPEATCVRSDKFHCMGWCIQDPVLWD